MYRYRYRYGTGTVARYRYVLVVFEYTQYTHSYCIRLYLAYYCIRLCSVQYRYRHCTTGTAVLHSVVLRTKGNCTVGNCTTAVPNLLRVSCRNFLPAVVYAAIQINGRRLLRGSCLIRVCVDTRVRSID